MCGRHLRELQLQLLPTETLRPQSLLETTPTGVRSAIIDLYLSLLQLELQFLYLLFLSLYLPLSLPDLSFQFLQLPLGPGQLLPLIRE